MCALATWREGMSAAPQAQSSQQSTLSLPQGPHSGLLHLPRLSAASEVHLPDPPMIVTHRRSTRTARARIALRPMDSHSTVA